MKSDVCNVVSDADDMEKIWRNLLNVENQGDGEVAYSEVMVPCYLTSEIQLKIGKASGLTGD